jgi:DNA-directed RNA polymerase specialized sigma24 family protein
LDSSGEPEEPGDPTPVDPRHEVSDGELTEAEQDERTQRAADHLQRRLADGELYEALAKANFEGPGYNLFVEELAAYGLAVTRAWIITGKMFAQCARRGYPIGPRPHDIDDHDVETLAGETVTLAVLKFREHGLLGGKWRPDGGASLKTYFITGCVFAFLNPYKSWTTRRRNEQRLPVEPSDEDFSDRPAEGDLESRVTSKVEAHRIYRGLEDKEKKILLLHSHGYNATEIAEILADDSKPGTIRQTRNRLLNRLKAAESEGKERRAS